MPRISAATVAEHRAAQRRALLDAARELLAEDPETPPSFSTIAARAGLARSSVYAYFRSREDLLQAVVEEAFPRWAARITEAMDRADDGPARVRAYVETSLALVAEGEHAVVRALASFTPQAFADPRVRAMHDALVDPLVAELRAEGVAEPEITAELVNAVVHKGTEMIEAGRSLASVRAALLDLVRT